MNDLIVAIERHLTFGASIAVLGFVFTQHKIWVRMKDRLNVLWSNHCKDTGDEYMPLENGKH